MAALRSQHPDRRSPRPSTTPAKTLAAYGALATGVEALIAQDGNNSNMILDPDSDAYYLMDAVLNRRHLAAWTRPARPGDLQTVIAAGGRATLAKRLALEDLKSSILTTLANNDPDYASAFANTHDRAMKGRLSAPLAAFDHSHPGGHGAARRRLSRDRSTGAAPPRLGAVADDDALALSRATLPVINHLLDVRLGGFGGASLQTEIIALIGVLIALYLFAGFYLSVRRSQAVVVDGLAQTAGPLHRPAVRGTRRAGHRRPHAPHRRPGPAHRRHDPRRARRRRHGRQRDR